MLLKEILQYITESEASDQAHSLGLRYKGRGFWMNKQGQTVAQTVQGQLVKYEPEEGESKYNDSGKKKEEPAQVQDAPSSNPTPQISEEQVKFVKGKTTIPPNTVLNGVPLQTWKDAPEPPSTVIPPLGAYEDSTPWIGIGGTNPNIKEPPMQKTTKRIAAGVIVMEPDGRVWVVEPTNHYAGYKATFPKGTKDAKLSIQETAIKETYEESGLQVELTDFLTDSDRTESISRYYLGKRIGGSPLDYGAETQGVHLVPLDKLKNILNTPQDHKIVDALMEKLKGKSETPEAPVAEKKPELTAEQIMKQKVNVGIKTGYNSGGTYMGADGKVRYVKFYKEGAMCETEKMSADMYKDLGMVAPNDQTFEYNGQTGFASEILPNVKCELIDDPGTKKNSYGEAVQIDPVIANKILDGFVADCFMANWDVLGVNEGYMRNILVMKDNSIARIDQGAAFLFRGSGGRKQPHLLDALGEWDFFATGNPSYKVVFSSLGLTSADQLGDRAVKQIQDILDLEQKSGGWDNYVKSMAPKLPPKDQAQVAQMLNKRTEILKQKQKQLSGK